MSISALIPKGVFYKLGATGETVKQIQRALAQLGYPLTGTGYFGSATDTAVEAFQRRAGLTVDGAVGVDTAAAIDRALGSNQAAVPAAVKAEIAQPLWLQAGLKLIGVHEGRDDPEILEWAKEEGGQIAKVYKDTATPWCALGINHIMTKAGIKGTETLWALDWAGKWPSVKLLGPAVGAIAPMKRPGGGHVACVVGKDQRGNLMMLGFNQGDACSILPFPVGRPVGFWWPSSVVLPSDIGMSVLPVVKSNGTVSSKEF